MADSPFARWLLYGSDTPVRDFLTNDANLLAAQNSALGIATAAAAVATGGMVLEAAPGLLAGLGSGGSSTALLTAAGAAAASPQAQEELETLLPELKSSLSQELSETVNTEASALFQARDEAAETARRIVQQEINEGVTSPGRAQARFGNCGSMRSPRAAPGKPSARGVCRKRSSQARRLRSAAAISEPGFPPQMSGIRPRAAPGTLCRRMKRHSSR